MLDHVSLPVRDLAVSTRFYDAALAPLGYERGIERENAVGYWRTGDRSPGLWLLAAGEGSARAGRGLHLCFSAATHQAVRNFHRTALEAGGWDAGAPGPRPHYSDDFYGSFVFDPDGYKIEATCRGIPVPAGP